MQLDGGLRDPKRLAQGIDFGGLERRENDQKIDVGGGVELAFGGAAVKDDGDKIGAERVFRGLQKRIENLRDGRRELRL
jgi:hypothetical protein